MKKSIFRYVLAASVSITIVSFLLMVFFAYGYLSDILRDHLREELDLAARGVEMSGGEYLRGFTDKSLRFTWVDAGGTVIFDSEAGAQGMENHLSREEISEALESGSGESVRYSDTLSELRVIPRCAFRTERCFVYPALGKLSPISCSAFCCRCC